MREHIVISFQFGIVGCFCPNDAGLFVFGIRVSSRGDNPQGSPLASGLANVVLPNRASGEWTQKHTHVWLFFVGKSTEYLRRKVGSRLIE